MRARILSITMVAGAIMAAAPAVPATAAATSTYIDSTHSISLQYPSGWKVEWHVKTGGIAAQVSKTADLVYATDQSAVMAVLVQNARLPVTTANSIALSLFEESEVLMGPVVFSHFTHNHQLFYAASGPVKSKVNGVVAQETVYSTLGARHTYYLGVTVFTNAKSHLASARAVQDMLNTVTAR